MTKIIAPSILSANFANLEQDITLLNQSIAEWIHIDVMDGRFVPNLSFGFPVISALRPLSNKFFDVHLMIEEPEKYVDEFVKCGADSITIHIEACKHLHRNIQQIKALGTKVGVALNPHTPVQTIKDIIQDLDLILIMSVNPGFGGQKFISQTFNKIKEAKQLIEKNNSQALIQIDGGVNTENAKLLFESGADVLVAGNAVFNSANPMETIATLLNYSE